MRTDKTSAPAAAVDYSGAGELGQHYERQLRERRATTQNRQREDRESGPYMTGVKHSYNGSDPK